MKKLTLQVVIIFVLTVLMARFVEGVVKNLWLYKIAFPEQYALDDFEFEDFSFSDRKTQGSRDKNITLINIGDLERGGIAEQIKILDEYNPKVIGIDVLFNCPDGLRDTVRCPQLKDSIGNQLFHEALKKTKKVVLASTVLQKKSNSTIDSYDSIEYSDHLFADYAINGFSNLPTGAVTQNDVKLCRSFIPTVKVNGTDHSAFAVEVSKKFDANATATFLEHAGSEPLINYRGNVSIKSNSDPTYQHIGYFKTYDAADVLRRNFAAEDIKDKIVLMGYLGDYLSDQRMDAMYYSPLNVRPLGKSLPDMYGLVVQANIITMILNGDLIKKMSPTTSLVLSVLIAFLNIILFIAIEHGNTVWKEAFVILVPTAQIVFFSLLRYITFTEFNYIIDLRAATILLVSVSLSTTLYFGPILHIVKKVRGFLTK